MNYAFDDCHKQLININEKGLSMDPKDPGNWSSGVVGEGTLEGSMYGISAPVARRNKYMGPMQYLSLEVAKAIAKREYWDPHSCDQMDGRIAFLVFDAAYNGGHPNQWLQQAVGVNADGVIGAQTIAAVRGIDPLKVCMRFQAYHNKWLKDCAIWPSESRGWTDRQANNLLFVSQ